MSCNYVTMTCNYNLCNLMCNITLTLNSKSKNKKIEMKNEMKINKVYYLQL